MSISEMRKGSVTSEISIEQKGKHSQRRYTLTPKVDDDEVSSSPPRGPAPLLSREEDKTAPPKLKKAFTITSLFKKKKEGEPSPTAESKKESSHRSSASLGSQGSPGNSPRTSLDPVKRKDLTFTHSEARRITNTLDTLAINSQNPLLGMDSDDEEDLLREPELPVSATSMAQLASLFPEDTPEEKAVSTRTIEAILKTAMDSSNGWTAEMLPIVARTWYPPEMWPNNSEAVFDRSSYMLPQEEILTLLDKEAKMVEALLNKKQNEIRTLRQGDLNLDPELVEKETKLRTDAIRHLEYKQWKLISHMERVADKTAIKPALKLEMMVVEEKNEKGEIIRLIRVKDGKHSVQAGTLEALILSNFDESNQDINYTEDFLLGYRMYLSSGSLLSQITEMVQSGKIKRTAAVRVGTFLKKWVQKYWRADFGVDRLSDKLLALWSLIASDIKAAGKQDELDISLFSRMTMTQEASHEEAKLAHLKKPAEPAAVAQYGNQSEDNPLSFLSLAKNLEEFVGILGEIELRLFQGIRPEEFLEKLLWKGAQDEVNPKTTCLFGLINWVNQLGYWMATEICLCYDLKDRIRVLTRFVEIAKECAKMGLYNSVFAITTGLNNSSIARLKQTWGGLPKKTQADFAELEQVCNPQFNYKKYRSIEQEAQPPFVPFIGMHMRDMFFMNDGNPNKLSNGLYTFDKLRTLSSCIEWVLSFQTKTYLPSVVKEERLHEYVQHINGVEPLQERHLHKMSCQCEPPEWRKRANFNRRADDLL